MIFFVGLLFAHLVICMYTLHSHIPYKIHSVFFTSKTRVEGNPSYNRAIESILCDTTLSYTSYGFVTVVVMLNLTRLHILIETRPLSH